MTFKSEFSGFQFRMFERFGARNLSSLMLSSVRMDGRIRHETAIFRPYRWKIAYLGAIFVHKVSFVVYLAELTVCAICIYVYLLVMYFS